MSYANDDFANATLLTGTSGSITPIHYDGSATSESGEDVYGTGETLWWKWVAPSTGTAWFTTRYSPSDDADPNGLDTKIQVFTDFSTSIASNDDDPSPPADSYRFNSYVEVDVTSGTTYWIQVDFYSSGEAGTLHLAWAVGPPPVFDIAAVWTSSVVMPAGYLIPEADHNYAYLTGTHLEQIDTVTFSGGATAAVGASGAGTFRVPTDLATIRSGPATFSGGGHSQTVDVILLKPEPTFSRTIAPRTITNVVEYDGFSGQSPGLYSSYSVYRNFDGTTLFDAVANPGHDADYQAVDSTSPSKTYMMCLVRVGWAAGFSGSGLVTSRTADADLPAPGPVYLVDRQDAGLASQSATLALRNSHTGSYTLQFPVQAQGPYQNWSDFTAEVYGIQADELFDQRPDFDFPEAGSTTSDWWRSPAWFNARSPLATHDFGSLGPGPVVSDTVDLTLTVPDEYIWQGDGDQSVYSLFIVILKRYRDDANDENPPIGTQGVIRFAPRPGHEAIGTSSNYSSENLAISTPIQEAPYRYWLPELPTGGWQVGSVAW